MTTTEIIAAPTPAPLLPMEPHEARRMMTAYRELCESILDDDDVIGRPGEPGGFVKRSGWQKLATFYRVSTEIIYNGTDHDEEGKPIRARAVVRATHESGRSADGDGACAITEPRFKGAGGRQKAEHDMPATAVTRATNRAVSNLIGFGSVSAEEVEAEEAVRHAFGPPATTKQEDGMMRALEDLGALVKPATRLIDKCGYLPQVGALMAMYIAASVADQADGGQRTEVAPTAASEDEPLGPEADDVPWDEPEQEPEAIA